MSVSASLSIELAGTLRGVNPLGNVNFDFRLSDRADFLPGTAANQANLLFSAERTIAASATDDLDLAGPLAHPLGGLLTFAVVRAIVVTADPLNVNNLVIGGAPSNGFLGPFGAAAHTIALRPGEDFAITNRGPGWPVVAGTGDLLRLANSGAGTAVKYKILILGS